MFEISKSSAVIHPLENQRLTLALMLAAMAYDATDSRRVECVEYSQHRAAPVMLAMTPRHLVGAGDAGGEL